MSVVSYNHAVVLSPCLYAPTLYGESPDVSSTCWRHEDATRHLCTQLMSKYPGVMLRSMHAIHSVPDDFWTDANRVDACFFSQASRIILFVPNDGENQIRSFTSTCLSPLLTRPRQEGGRPEWHSRFLAVAVGNVETPNQLAQGHPFIKVIRFREVGWVRDLTALILLHREIRDFWLPPRISKPAASQSILTPMTAGSRYRDAAKFRLRETVETTLMTNVSTRVAGSVDPDTVGSTDAEVEPVKPDANGIHENGGHEAASHQRGKLRSLSRSRSRRSSSSGYQSRDPDFEAEQSDEKQVEMRLTSFMDATGRPTVWRFLNVPVSNSESFKLPPSIPSENLSVAAKQIPLLTSDRESGLDEPTESSDIAFLREKEKQPDFPKTHREDATKSLPEVTAEEQAKRNTVTSNSSVSVQVPKAEIKSVPDSCLLDSTTSYRHPDDKVTGQESEGQLPQCSRRPEQTTHREDSFSRRPSLPKSRVTGRLSPSESPTTSSLQSTSRGNVPVERPCPLAEPEDTNQPPVSLKVSIEQYTCFVTSKDSSDPKPAVKMTDKVTSEQAESVVVDSHSSSFDQRFAPVAFLLVESQCGYQQADATEPSPAMPADGDTPTHDIHNLSLPEGINITSSEPLLTGKLDYTNDLRKRYGHEQRTTSDSIVTSKRRIKSVVCKTETLSGSYWKVKKSTEMQVPVEGVGKTEELPPIESVDSTSSPQCHDSSLHRTPPLSPDLTELSETAPGKVKMEEMQDTQALPGPGCKPSSTVDDEKQPSQSPDIDGPISPSVRLVPIHVVTDPETRPRTDQKGVVECYSSFTTAGRKAKLHSSTVKKTSTRKSVISTATEPSESKGPAPETLTRSPRSHVHRVYSVDPCGAGEADPTGHLRSIPNEVTMFYRDPHAGHSRQEGGQSGNPSRIERPRSSRQYLLSSPSLHQPRSTTSNRIIYIRTQIPPQRVKSEDRCSPSRSQNPSAGSTAPGLVRIYRSRGFANQDNLLSDASSQIESALASGFMEGHGVTCYASTGLHYRRKRSKPLVRNGEPGACSILLKDQNNWTGPDAAIIQRLELERLQWGSDADTTRSERIEIIKPTVDCGKLTPAEGGWSKSDLPDSSDEVVVAESPDGATAQTTTNPQGRPRGLLALYIGLAGLTLLLSMVVAFLCLGQQSRCSTGLDLHSLWQRLARLTDSLASPFSQPELD